MQKNRNNFHQTQCRVGKYKQSKLEVPSLRISVTPETEKKNQPAVVLFFIEEKLLQQQKEPHNTIDCFSQSNIDSVYASQTL